jgi:dTDP-4-amino-4,6-dideoxygalactose transaminase
MKVPFFDYKQLYLKDKKAIDKIVNNIASRGAFILQKEVDIFEKKICNYTKSKYAISVANGTDAMQIYLKAFGIKRGDEVILSSHTMIATASAIKFCGAKPVPVDINKIDGLIKPEAIEKKINKKTKAIIVTHLNGRTCEMDKIIKLSKKYKLKIFEDAAQALGSRYKNKFAGTFGAASSISFYPAKILGCLGDGGIILTNNKIMAQKMRIMRDHGRHQNGKIKYWGYNSRLDNIQAGVLNYFFSNFKNIIKKRRKIARIYNKSLKEINQIQTPILEKNSNINFDTFQNYEIQAENRNLLKKFLLKRGIGTLIPWNGVAINRLKNLGINYDLKNSDIMFKKLLMLPMNNFLDISQIDYVVSCIKEFYKSKSI